MSSILKIGAVIVGLLVLTLIFFQPSRQLVAGLFDTNDQPIDDQAISQLLQQTPLDAATLVGQNGLYYLNAANFIGTLATDRYSAYEDLIAEDKIPVWSTLLTDKDKDEILKQAQTDKSSGGVGNNVTPTSNVILNSFQELKALSSGTLSLTITNNTITGSVIQSGLKTSLLVNDAGFLTNLLSFTTDNLTQGSTNKYSQWTNILSGISYGQSVTIAQNLTLSQFTANGGLLYTTASGQLSQLPVGTTGQCLKSSGTIPAWGTCAATNALSGAGVAGQVAFFDGVDSVASDSGLLWNNTDKRLSFGSGVGSTSRINLPAGTTAADGINFGDNLALYRSQAGVLRITGGNLSIGNISADPLGVIYTPVGLSNSVSTSNARVAVLELGAQITRNIADANPALIIHQKNAGSTGDLLQLINSASTRLSVSQAGALTIANYTTNGGLLYTNGSGAVTQLAAGATGQCLTATTGAAAAWNSCTPVNNLTGSGTAGQVAYWDGINSTAGSNTFLWNNASARLSLGANPAQTGVIALRNDSSINFRNAANSADVVGLRFDSANIFTIANGAISAGGAGGATTLTVGSNNGNVGIGTSPTAGKLEVVSTGTTTHGTQITANSLTTGRGLNISSTSTALTTGGLVGLSWTPASATTMTGDLFSVNVGPNGTVGNLLNLMNDGLSVFSVSQSLITANVPIAFMAAGDMSIAYDLQFTNVASGNIKSNGPLRLQAGEPFNSSDLTLGTYDNGVIMFDSGIVGTATGTKLGLGIYNPTARLSLAAGTAATDGIAFGTDTNLYRSAADTLRTDDLLIVNSLQIGSGAALTAMYSATTTWDPASINSAETDFATLTVTGAAVGDLVTVSFSQTIPDGLILTAQVSATNTIRVTLLNSTASPVDLSSGTIRVQVNKF